MTKYGAGSSVDTIATSKIIALDTLQSQDNAPHFTGCWVGSLQSNLWVLGRMDGNRPAGIKGSNNGVPSSPPPLLLSIPIDLWDRPGNIIIPIRWLDIPPSTVRRRVLFSLQAVWSASDHPLYSLRNRHSVLSSFRIY